MATTSKTVIKSLRWQFSHSRPLDGAVSVAELEDTDAVNEAGVKIALMGGGLKAKLVNKELNYEMLETGTSFGVTLKGTMKRKDMFARVEILTKTFAVPGAIGIVNGNVARLLRRGAC